MLVSQVMQKDFVTVKQTDLIQEAANKMKEKHVPILLVLEEDHVKGILMEKEVTKAVAALSAGAGPSLANSAAADAAVSDDSNRCCYFNDVQVELLLRR